jgi:metal-responsive CopG/Arc/MetJ family transcriptional regulator
MAMFKSSLQTQGTGYRGTTLGKRFCVSVPGHELHLMDDMDEIAETQRITRSQLLRRWIRQHKEEELIKS